MFVAAKKPIAERLLEGDRSAVARLITWAENGDRRFAKSLQSFYPKIGRARRIGVTGPPGAGKSTLVNELVGLLRSQERTVGVLAVDPSSPFSGGALLGDRIRMEERTIDPGVFIRSMASRESHGGLARATIDACDVMDAFGFDDIVIETVGVGQAEYDVVSAADSVVVVLCPGAGDSIQAMKAGLLEVADVLAVNKDDLPGADRLVADLEEATHVRLAGKERWMTPVVSCSAGKGRAVDSVLGALEDHLEALGSKGLADMRRQMRSGQVRMVAREWIDQALWENGVCKERVESELKAGRTPYDVAEELRAQLMGGDLGVFGASNSGGASDD
jgi:LAO/AO transport system kinase